LHCFNSIKAIPPFKVKLFKTNIFLTINLKLFRFLHSNKIISVCPQIFDLVIRDWLEPPWSLESPQPKQAAVKPRVEKSEMVFLFQPQSSPTLCAEGGEFGPLLEVVWLHIHPFIDGEFALT
jgi:hypothetical protein